MGAADSLKAKNQKYLVAFFHDSHMVVGYLHPKATPGGCPAQRNGSCSRAHEHHSENEQGGGSAQHERDRTHQNAETDCGERHKGEIDQ